MTDPHAAITAWFAGDADSSQVADLEQWLRDDPAHRAEFLALAQVHGELAGHLAPAHGNQRLRMPVVMAGLAAAAILAIAIGAFGTGFTDTTSPPVPANTHAPVLTDLTVVSSIETQAEAMRCRTGDHAVVDIDPESRVRHLSDRPGTTLALDHGGVHCAVTPGRGHFEVITSAGSVVVTGTEFSVRYLPPQEPTMAVPRCLVTVLTGSVLLTGPWGSQALHAGESETIPPAPVHAQAPADLAEKTVAQFDVDFMLTTAAIAESIGYTGDQPGVMVRDIAGPENSPVWQLQGLDVILSANGELVTDLSEFQSWIENKRGQKVAFTILRDRATQTITLTIPEITIRRLLNLDFEDDLVSDDYFSDISGNGSEPALDHTVTRSGKASLRLEKTEGRGHPTYRIRIPGAPFAGQRVKITAWIKGENVSNLAHTFALSEGNKQIPKEHKRPFTRLQGSFDWRPVTSYARVTDDGKDFTYGATTMGGKIWVDDITIEAAE